MPSYFQSFEHLLRYCARPPFALERLSVTRDAFLRIARVRYVLPRRWVTIWAANWVGPGRSRKSTRPGANGVVELTPFEFLDADWGELVQIHDDRNVFQTSPDAGLQGLGLESVDVASTIGSSLMRLGL